MRKCGN